MGFKIKEILVDEDKLKEKYMDMYKLLIKIKHIMENTEGVIDYHLEDTLTIWKNVPEYYDLLELFDEVEEEM